MKRDEAIDHIARLMEEWFPGDGYTPEFVREEMDLYDEDDASINDPLMHYPVFALQLLDRLGLLD